MSHISQLALKQIERNSNCTNSQEQIPHLLGIKEAAEALGISEWTVRYLLRTRQIARVRIGTRVLIPASELARFIEAHTEPATTPINPKYRLGAVASKLVDRTDE